MKKPEIKVGSRVALIVHVFEPLPASMLRKGEISAVPVRNKELLGEVVARTEETATVKWFEVPERLQNRSASEQLEVVRIDNLHLKSA